MRAVCSYSYTCLCSYQHVLVVVHDNLDTVSVNYYVHYCLDCRRCDRALEESFALATSLDNIFRIFFHVLTTIVASVFHYQIHVIVRTKSNACVDDLHMLLLSEQQNHNLGTF